MRRQILMAHCLCDNRNVLQRLWRSGHCTTLHHAYMGHHTMQFLNRMASFGLATPIARPPLRPLSVFTAILSFGVITLANGPALALNTSGSGLFAGGTVQTVAIVDAPFDDTLMHAHPRHTIPDDLPPLVSETSQTTSKQHRDTQHARHAMARQIFWRYDRGTVDFKPWFQASQSKKHAAITGPAHFAIMALVFLLMSGVTIALWRQTGRKIPNRVPRTLTTRRIR